MPRKEARLAFIRSIIAMRKKKVLGPGAHWAPQQNQKDAHRCHLAGGPIWQGFFVLVFITVTTTPSPMPFVGFRQSQPNHRHCFFLGKQKNSVKKRTNPCTGLASQTATALLIGDNGWTIQLELPCEENRTFCRILTVGESERSCKALR